MVKVSILMEKRVWTRVEMSWPTSVGLETDALVGWLALLGIEGSEEIESPGKLGLRFYFPPSVSHRALLTTFQQMLRTHLGELASQLSFAEEEVEERDWMEEWKKNFDVLQLSEHLWICPSWKEFKASPGHFVMWIDPGMAFGTGHHPSTRLIAQAMEDHLFDLQRRQVSPSVLDVGTGTGVLALGAALLGASKIVATDNDPEAVRIAQENVTINDQRGGFDGRLASRVSVESVPLEKMRRKFDLIIANIIAETHVQLMASYVKRIEQGGLLLMSGIIQERVDMVHSKLRELGWVILNRREQGEWVCLTAIEERRRTRREANVPFKV